MARLGINVKSLNKEINKQPVLDNISFSASPAKITTIFYNNEYNVNILFNALVRLCKIDSGNISFFGHNIAKERDYVMNFVGFKPSKHKSFNEMKVINYFEYSSMFYPGNYLSNALDLLKYFNLDTNLKLKSLTNSEKQILSTIDAVFFNPEVIILSDPFIDLYVDHQTLLKDLLLKLRAKGVTILISSNDLNKINYYDQAIFMKDNKLIDMDDNAKLLNTYKLIKVYANDLSLEVLKNKKVIRYRNENNMFEILFKGNEDEAKDFMKKFKTLSYTILEPSINEIYEVVYESA